MKLQNFENDEQLVRWFKDLVRTVEPSYEGREAVWTRIEASGIEFRLLQENVASYVSRFAVKPKKVLGVQLSVRDNRYRAKIKRVMVKDFAIDEEDLRSKYKELKYFKEGEDEEATRERAAEKSNNEVLDQITSHVKGCSVSLEYQRTENSSFSVKFRCLNKDQVIKLYDFAKANGIVDG